MFKLASPAPRVGKIGPAGIVPNGVEIARVVHSARNFDDLV